MVDLPRVRPKVRRSWLYGGVALGAILVATVLLAGLKPAVPTVERGGVWLDTVRRGTMLREVRGPGLLVPEQIRWISALTPGRVERIALQPGQAVKRGTILLELSNPDVELQLLESERQLAGAEAELVSLGSSLQTGRLRQAAAVATARTQLLEAQRQRGVNEELARRQIVAPNELSRAREQADELEARYAIEQEQLKVLSDAMAAQLAAQRAQVARLRAVVAFRRRELDALRIAAGADGVLQELPLQVGQWVTPGITLAKVVEPGRLKAVLRVPETQARELVVGQRASIDTRNGPAGIAVGRVVRIDPAAQGGTVGADVAFSGPLPPGSRPDLSVDGIIEIERIADVLYVGRPANADAEGAATLYRLTRDGGAATRVRVALGRASVSTIEVRAGLKAGDVVILSDMSQVNGAERIRLR